MPVVDVRHRVPEEQAAEQRPYEADGGGGHQNGISGKSVHFDKNEGTSTLQLPLSDKILGVEEVDIPNLVTAVINTQNKGNTKDKIISGWSASTSTSRTTNSREEEIVKDVKINVEEETDDEEEVIELEFERSFERVHTHTPYCPKCNSQITKVVLRRRRKPVERPEEPIDCFGCLKCFSFFIPTGGFQNPFGFFGAQPKPDQPVSDTSTKPGADGGTKPGEDVTHIPRPGVSDTDGCSKAFEILKCIVHGGLMESIASLSVVSSAAASDVATVNIIAIGFATVISSLFAFGHNLMDLKNDSSGGQSDEQVDRYQELLGKRDNFLLHTTFAMLSFLVFGLIPPAIYGFTFRESDNKDYKSLAVAGASFACILVLAIAKAHIGSPRKLSWYFKTVMYYVIMAISISGVAYAAGDLFKKLMDELGWFKPSQLITSFVPGSISLVPA